MLVVSCPRPGFVFRAPRFVFRVPRFVLRAPIFGHLMVDVRRNGEDRGTVPPLLLLPLNPGSFLATVFMSEAANIGCSPKIDTNFKALLLESVNE